MSATFITRGGQAYGGELPPCPPDPSLLAIYQGDLSADATIAMTMICQRCRETLAPDVPASVGHPQCIGTLRPGEVVVEITVRSA